MYQADLTEIIIQNQIALKNLRRALTLGHGQFSLILVRINYQRLTHLLLGNLAETQNFHTVELSSDTRSLSESITASLISLDKPPSAVMVTGFDQVEKLDVMFKAVNVGRNALISKFPCPVVLWMTDTALQTLTIYAADLKSFAAVPIRIDYPLQALTEALHRAADKLFQYILDCYDSLLFDTSTPPLPDAIDHFTILTKQELSFAINDLTQHTVQIDGALKASLDFLQGRETHNPGSLAIAREYYERSLKYWLQTDQRVEDTGVQQAVLLLHLGWWWETHAKLQHSTYLSSYHKARRFYEKFIDILRQQNRYDSMAVFVHILAETLQKLSDWEALSILANESRALHQGDWVRLARDHGYLAEAALASNNWNNAQRFATEALKLLAQAVKSTQTLGRTVANNVSKEISSHSSKASPEAVIIALRYHQGRYYFLRGQAKLHQKNNLLFEEALHDLENARQRLEPRYDFSLYRKILTNLQNLYFAKQRYRDAFSIKQEQQQVESLMGLRAFIGANPIQPYRSLSQTLDHINKTSSTKDSITENQHDIDHILKILIKPQSSILVLHKQPKMGGKLLLSDNLVPTLQEAISETGTTLSLLIRDYQNWTTSILEALQTEGSIDFTVSPISTREPSKSKFSILEDILTQLKLKIQNNYNQIVFIFDQFEKIFDELSDIEQRKIFYTFLKKCTDTSGLRIILVLRDDYLHLLVEGEHLANLDINYFSHDQQHSFKSIPQLTGYDKITSKMDDSEEQGGTVSYVNHLMEPRFPLLVIQGDPGIERSSLLGTELLQALRQVTFEGRKTLPLLVHNYRNWTASIFQALQTSILTGSTTKPPSIDKLKISELSISEEDLLTQLRQQVQDKYQQVVLIFDQFEKFFDERPDIEQRKKLYVFLKNCLNTPYLKIVLALRDEYLHYLKEWEFLVKLEIDPLSSDILHPYRSNGLRLALSVSEVHVAGRRRDVMHLVDRLMQPQFALVVLHGQSGVGKSSLLSSGLVPVLRQATSDGRTTLPLLIRNYTSWEISVLQALQRVTSSLPAAPPNFQVSFPITGESLLNHLRQHAQDYYQQIILIFDQFEEFFFERPTLEQRRSLYQFLRNCVNTPYFKVVLTLRDDYLHYLLEWKRLTDFDLDILSQDVRYYLGNFTPKECEIVIQQLTENAQFYLEKPLIAALVTDLSASDGEVRPIELQIVGAELQRENITTLKRYKELGNNPIRALVLNFLNQVVRDCGPENSTLARTILYLLSDGTITRPLKTLTELEESLESLGILVDPEQLSLVLEILTNSGLLFESPEVSGSVRYQLAHDYLIDLVKQQDMPGLITVLEAERKRRKQSETQLRTALQEQAMALAQATEERYRAETAEMQALASVSQALLLSHDGLGALLEALKGAQQSQLTPISGYLENQILFRLWQALHTVREKNRIHAHQDWVLSACFSPDGQYLASSSDDGTVRLWNARGKLLQVFIGHQGSVLDVAFSQDSCLIGSAGDDFKVRIWDMSGQCLQILTGHTGAVNSLAFSPTQKLIASASNDHTVRLWTHDGQWLKTLEGHLDWVRSIAFSADGQYLVSAAEDGTLCLWNTEGELLQAMSSHAGWLLQAVFSPDGQHIASCGDDHLIKLWNLNGELLQYFEGHQNWVRDLCFSPDGTYLMSAGDDQNIHIWDMNGKLLDTLKGHRSSVLSLGINPQGTQLISASDDNTIRLWQLESRDIPSLQGHHGIVWDVCWQPNGSKLVSAGADQTLKIWATVGGEHKLLHTQQAHNSSIYSVDWSPDGRLIASASADHTVKLWTADGEPLHTCQGHQNAIWSVNFSPDGTYLASAGSDRNIRFWYTDGTPIGQLSGHEGTVWTVAFSPDGKYLVSGSEDGTLRQWDLTGLTTSDASFADQTGTILPGHTGSVWAVAVAPDSQIIASAGSDNTIRLWKEGDLLQILRGHHDWVRSVSFGLNGDVIASASDDGTIRFWQLPSGQPLHTFTGHRGIIWQGSFNNTGDRLASAGADGQVRLWNLQMQDLMRQSCQWIEDYLAYGDLSDADRLVCEDFWE